MNLKKFNELNDEDKLLEQYRLIKRFNIEELADLTVDILNTCTDEERLERANKVGDLVMFMLEEKGLVKPGVQQTFVDILITSCLLHNIVDVTFENWNVVYEIRKIIMKQAKEGNYNIPESALEMICDTIEGQLGERMPIKGSRPNPNTPGELFTLAVAIIYRYIK